MTLLIALATFVSTLLGGLFALRFKDKLHLILGFSAGAVIAVAFFDLMPEAIALGAGSFDPSTMLAITAAGFLSYMLLDRLIDLHSHNDEDHSHSHKGRLGAGSLSIHSFLDGAAIGLAFQVSGAVGLIVAAAVLVHDFSDGINTVSVVLKNRGKEEKSRSALTWLFIDALAPIAGVLSTHFFTLSQGSLAVVLAAFSGFFLYIGASDLLPESHHNHPTIWTTFMTLLGAGTIFLVIHAVSL